METPVAPIGWPLLFRPPDGFTGSLPFFSVQPSLMARALALGGQPHGLVFDQFGDGEAVVGLDERKIVKRHAGLIQRLTPDLSAALEL
jgi:hypothetical protein